jgi:prepilin-type N-terminal cleavage/methylation domain-containing protein
MSKSRAPRQVGMGGFTLLEVMVAIFILTVGLVSLAALAGAMVTSGNRSKYLSMEAQLATEKLEDLNRWPADTPQVCVPTGTASLGSLTSDILQTTTCNGGSSASVAYYDDVNINFANSTTDCATSTGGCLAETVTNQSGGTTQYTTTYHSPDGSVSTATTTSAPTNMTFHRRWIIEANSPVTGVRRVTVLVSISSANVQPSATFEMSMVRP